VVPIKHRMYYVHRQHVLQNNENQCTVVHTGWVYRDIRFWVPPLTHTQWVWVIPTGMTRYAYYLYYRAALDKGQRPRRLLAHTHFAA
jgi:hypothetical protein